MLSKSLGLAVFVLSCSSQPDSGTPRISTPDSIVQATAAPIHRLSDSTILLHLPDDILLTWNEHKQSFEADSLYKAVKNRFLKNPQTVVDLITDSTEVPVRVCRMEHNLKVGDVAFILLDAIYGIPYFKALGIQWDSYDDCPYPYGMFIAIGARRLEIKQKLELYLQTRKE